MNAGERVMNARERSANTKKRFTNILFLLLILFIAAFSPTSPRPVLLDPVTTQTGTTRVSYGTVEMKDVRYGLIRSHSEAVRLGAVSGILGTVYAWPGDKVTAGQLLAQMDIENLRERYETQLTRIANMRRLHVFVNEENALEIAILELSYANTIWNAAENFDLAAMERAERIRENIEWATLTKQQTIATQNANLAREEHRLAELRASLADANIYAPFDGTISYLVVRPGMWINTFAPLMYITCYNAPVFIEYIGQSLSLHQARSHIRQQGYIGTTVVDLELVPPTPEQQVYYSRRNLLPPIRFEVMCSQFEWPPAGTTISLHFYSRFYENVLRIPRNALFARHGYGHFVYRIENGQQVPTFITAGVITDIYVPVFDGLQEGDEILVRP